MNESIQEHICRMLKKWINHTKEGPRRSEEQLQEFDRFWNFLIKIILKSELSEDVEELRDFSKYVKYEGTLYRYHRKVKNKNDIEYDNQFASWTASSNPTVMYWIHKGDRLIKIEADTLKEENSFGISLLGLESYIRKYWIENFTIGSPAIQREQEIVFKMDEKFITRETEIVVE